MNLSTKFLLKINQNKKTFRLLGTTCTQPAIDDFPKDLFTEQQRQSGAVVLHAICSLYLFLALAVVCDKYFVPAVEKICTGTNTHLDEFFFFFFQKMKRKSSIQL